EEPVQSGGFEVPVGDQHPLPGGGEDPSHVGQRHGAAGTTLVRVEGDDLTLSGLTHRRRPPRRSAGSHPAGVRGASTAPPPDPPRPLSGTSVALWLPRSAGSRPAGPCCSLY